MDRPRGSSTLIAGFQTLKHIQQNEVAAERSRKTSRLSRGLDPNIPRPKNVHQGRPSTTQKNLKTRNSCSRGRWMTKPIRYRVWTSTRYLWNSFWRDSAPTWKLVYLMMLLFAETRKRETTSYQKNRKLQVGLDFWNKSLTGLLSSYGLDQYCVLWLISSNLPATYPTST